MKLFFLFLFAAFLSIEAMAQKMDSANYFLKGGLTVGHSFPVIQVELRNINNRLIDTATVQGIRGFRFDSLSNGTYKVVISEYGVDTAITISGKSLDFFLEVSGCEVNRMTALQDIKNSVPKLLLIGGIAPVYIKDQYKFEEKYRVSYYEYGCVAPDHGCVIEYNKEIFKYLDKKFKKAWRKEVRTDVIGLN